MKHTRQVRNLAISLLLTFLIGSIIPMGCKKNPDSTPSGTTPNLKLIADGLVSPVQVVEPPDGTRRLFVVDQAGKIWIIAADGTKMPSPFLDLSSKIVSLGAAYDERGLLSMAFHPGFKTNGKFYVFYTPPPRPGGPDASHSWNNLTRISEFKVSATNTNLADLSSERVILEENHPQSNHNGGTVAFGPDGLLYISIGDGGNKDDVGPGHVDDWYKENKGGNGQDIYANLLGNILRIDVNSGSPYAIPPDNPYMGTRARGEIYAFGFRNPYRFSFDMGGSHQLFSMDAGQSLYEEINLVTRGGNYGWNVKEGTHCFDTDSDLLERGSCPMVDSAGKPLVDPIIELVNHSNPKGGGIALTIIGGYVYRGATLPALAGKYIFGIFSQDGKPNAKVYMATGAASGPWPWQELVLKDFQPDLGMYLKGLGQDQSGEVYLATSNQTGVSGTTGKIYKLVAQ